MPHRMNRQRRRFATIASALVVTLGCTASGPTESALRPLTGPPEEVTRVVETSRADTMDLPSGDEEGATLEEGSRVGATLRIERGADDAHQRHWLVYLPPQGFTGEDVVTLRLTRASEGGVGPMVTNALRVRYVVSARPSTE